MKEESTQNSGTNENMNIEVDRSTEYASIRAEILSIISVQQSYIIAMYTITIAILGIALGDNSIDPITFLLPYIILLSFQRILDAKKYHYLKLSAYLAVYTKNTWESDYTKHERLFEKSYGKNIKDSNRKRFTRIRKTINRLKKCRFVRVSSLHLCALCTALCLYRCWYEVFVDRVTNPLEQTITAIVSVMLFLFSIIWTRNALDAPETREKYIKVLRNAIENNENQECVSQDKPERYMVRNENG